MVTQDVLCLQNSKGDLDGANPLTQLDVEMLFDDLTYQANICNTLWSLKLSDDN